MAVTKIWAVTDSVSRVLSYAANPDKTIYSDICKALHYASDERKTVIGEEKAMYVTGVNCTAETAFAEMKAVQERFDKTVGNVAYHAYQSFKTGEVTPQIAHKLGVELAKRMWGDQYQVLVATHFNTGTYHNHLVINSVNMWNGKKFNCNEGAYWKLRSISDELCKENGLTVIKNPKGKTTRKPNSVIHYHAVIHQALKYAMKTDLVAQNVAMKVDRPKKNDYQPVFLDAEELQHLFEVVKGTKLELPVLVAAFYGLRRGEVCGLKWDAIDFERGTITIRHTVTSLQVDGKTKMYAQDSAKTKSSMRTLPLVGSFAEYFKEVKAAQEVNKKVCGNCYNYEYDGYVFVDELGNLMRPDYLTSYFPQYIQKHGCKRMRFHDLRHSCASLLLANGVPLKQIQEWLGHSDFSTTANIYAHLDYTSKLSSAKAMVSGMALPESVNFGSKWSEISDDGGKN